MVQDKVYFHLMKADAEVTIEDRAVNHLAQRTFGISGDCLTSVLSYTRERAGSLTVLYPTVQLVLQLVAKIVMARLKGQGDHVEHGPAFSTFIPWISKSLP